MGVPIQESGMTFVQFPKGHCLHIEKNKIYIKNQEEENINDKQGEC